MPMPEPTTGEDRSEFISRCMGDDVMVEDFPDTDQRLAVCQRQWTDARKDVLRSVRTRKSVVPVSRTSVDVKLHAPEGPSIVVTVGAREQKGPDDVPDDLGALDRRAILEAILASLGVHGPGLNAEGVRAAQDQILRAARRTARDIRAALRGIAAGTSRKELVRAVRRIDPEAARAAFREGLDEFRRRLTASGALRQGLTIAAEGGGMLGGADINALLQIDRPLVEPIADFVDDWAQTHVATLVTEVEVSTQKAIQGVIRRSFTEGMAPREAARPIRQILTARQTSDHMLNVSGLTRRQAAAVDRYLDGLLEEGVSRTQAVRRAARYSSRLLNYRSMNIARTEILRAANAGHQASYTQALREGLLDRRIHKKLWVTGGDDRVCPICSPMDGRVVEIESTFEVGFPNSQGIQSVQLQQHPPAHPQCRCNITVVESAGGTDPFIPL